ncbi:E3 ubiquitin-protein ligase MARCHF5-like [Oppia nitens]|uniref:E3 ubiquitin-protein ligase MARCHF5-like n=1 Tax=Oppia nitens TaxID=1686743 RepID=UPI0023DB97C2|nr:E3 ubiquitin-protein ligase MARCHF5-like [Oppia nitens]
MDLQSISADESVVSDEYTDPEVETSSGDEVDSNNSDNTLGLNILQNLECLINSSDDSIDTITERRQCWLCLGQEDFDPRPSTSLDMNNSLLHNHHQWLSPCRCKGTAKWIHNECLQLWIDEKQKLDTNVGVKCAQCGTQYVLMFPPNGKLIDVILWYESLMNNVSTYAMVLCVAGAVYMSAFSYGVLTCLQIIGSEKTTQLIEGSNKTIALLGFPSIPFILCAGKLINWENWILRLWRRHYQRIPFLAFFTGRPAEGFNRVNMERSLLGYENAVQIERNNGVINHIEINVSGSSICRAFCGALLLPTFAKYVGQCLYDSIESDVNKTILGGLTFIAIKGGLKIYLRQQQFIRQTKRRILNYREYAGSDSSDNN